MAVNLISEFARKDGEGTEGGDIGCFSHGYSGGCGVGRVLGSVFGQRVDSTLSLWKGELRCGLVAFKILKSMHEGPSGV